MIQKIKGQYFRKFILIISIIIVAVILAVPAYFYYNLYRKSQGETKEFIVKPGQSTQEIAQNLKKDNLIYSAFVFKIYTKIKGALLQVGVYRLSPAQSMKEILEILASGKASEYLITIPEGWRITQIDQYLAQKGVIKGGDLIKIASADEGYLFPDTYRLLPQSKPEEVRLMMRENFNKKTANLNINREVIILASIVEREVKFDEDRPKIAGVYFNRLEKGMKLEADPTIQYAKGNWDPIKISDYKNVKSSYNTYINEGLPPGPICNPGLKSIEAVLSPQKNSWLYFFHTQDGHAVYSATIEEHKEKLEK